MAHINQLGAFVIFMTAALGVAGFTTSAGATDPPITSVAFSPDGKWVVACSQAGISLFSYPKLEKQKTIEAAASNLLCLNFSPDGKHLAVGGGNPTEEGIVEIFSWPGLEPVAEFSEHHDSVRALVWQNKNRLFSASLDRSVKQWDLKRTKSLQTLKGHSKGVSALCFLEKQDLLVSSGEDHSIRVWDAKTGKKIRSLNQHTKPVGAMATRLEGDGLPMVASSSDDRTIRFWQPSIGRMVRYAKLEKKPLSLVWLDESRIAAACVDGKVRIVDAEELKLVAEVAALKGWAYAIAAHPSDGHFVVAGSDGQIVRI